MLTAPANSNDPTCAFTAEGRRRRLLASAQTVNVCLLGVCLVLCVFAFFLVISLLKMAPKYSAEVLTSGLEYKKAVRCLMERLYTCYISSIQARIIALLAMSSMLVNHQYTLRCSQTEIHITDQQIKML